MGYYSLIIKGILVPMLLAIFGVWTFKNIRCMRLLRIAPALPSKVAIQETVVHILLT